MRTAIGGSLRWGLLLSVVPQLLGYAANDVCRLARRVGLRRTMMWRWLLLLLLLVLALALLLLLELLLPFTLNPRLQLPPPLQLRALSLLLSLILFPFSSSSSPSSRFQLLRLLLSGLFLLYDCYLFRGHAHEPPLTLLSRFRQPQPQHIQKDIH